MHSQRVISPLMCGIHSTQLLMVLHCHQT